MKALHWAFVLVAIIFPISIVCRNLVNARSIALKDEVRINNAIDTATKDAIDQIITANSGFLVSTFEYDNLFTDKINVTPELAQEAVNTFFHTMAVNYNIPYKMSDTTSTNVGFTNSYIKNYFASYIPAVVVIAYDGFYIYSIDEDANNYYGYRLSSKIPYAYDVPGTKYTIGYTLGNDIYVCDRQNGKCYSGRINEYADMDELETKFVDDYFDLGITDPDSIAMVSSDMSMIVYSLKSQALNKLLLPISEDNDTPFLQDYNQKTDEIGEFHKKRREVITKAITECLRQEVKEHNHYADTIRNNI